MIKYCIDNDKMQWDYVKAYTNARYMVKEGFAYQDGLFTGYDEDQARLRQDRPGTTRSAPTAIAVVDATLQHPRCVMQLLKKHVEHLHARDGRDASAARRRTSS